METAHESESQGKETLRHEMDENL